MSNFNRIELTPEMELRKKNSMQILSEIESLQIEVNNHNPKVIVEIGTAEGGTLARWFEIPSAEVIVSLDYPIGTYGGQGYEKRHQIVIDSQKQAELTNKQFFSIDGDSKDINQINKLEELLNGRKIDFLFIDGDHTYQGVKNDFELYKKFLNEDAIVGFHDVIDSEFHRESGCFVSTFWNELKFRYDFKEFIFTNEYNHIDCPADESWVAYILSKGGFGGIGFIEYSKKKSFNENISLIVPIYHNAIDTIRNVDITVSSSKLINQVILYSNGSYDEENVLLKDYADTNPIIELHIKEDAIGFIKAVNESFKLCKNEYILCLNSDVYLYNDWEELLTSICLNPNNGLVGPVMANGFILGCSFIVKKSVLNKIGMLNEGFGLGYEDDVELSNRVTRNGYELGYFEYKHDFGVTVDTIFPIFHRHRQSFELLSDDVISIIENINPIKNKKFLLSTNVVVLKDLSYSQIRNILNDNDIFIVVNKSGDNFEKIRYDSNIVKIAHIFECTDEMNIDVLINSITAGKKLKIIDSTNIQLKKEIEVDLDKINYKYDIINLLIKENKYSSYLEIGVRDPSHNYDFINCELKHCVDPMVEADIFGEHEVTFRMTSDEFFKINKSKYDIILIDGLHIDEQVEKDIKNSLDFLNDNGTIVLHDCNPTDIYHAREDFRDLSTPAVFSWNGTVWKAIVKVRTELDIYTSTVDIDYGVSIIQKSSTPNKLHNDNPYYSYLKFDCDRKRYLNLISKEEFVEQYINKNIINTKKKYNFTWLAKYDDYSSMGILSQRIIENIKNSDVSCKSIIGETKTKNTLIYDKLSKDINHDLGIMFSYPDMINELNEFKVKTIYTGVDTTGGIPNFAENSNKADFLLTPSNISKQRMLDLGVKKPVFVFPHGIDPEIFKYKDRIKSDVFKFLYVGECSDRKGIFQLLEAFISVFEDNKNVELHIKSNNDMLFYGGDKINQIISSHKNIYWHTGNEGHDYVLDLYSQCHVYVYPSRADTFGMTLLEAMACGLPVISTNEPGATELIQNRYFSVRTKNVRVENHPWMLGEWGEPNISDLKLLMLKLYDKYDEIVSSNVLKENSDYIRENYSWDRVVENFEVNILPKLTKKTKILTLVSSNNNPQHIKDLINSLKAIREEGVINDVYIVENTTTHIKNEIVGLINELIDDNFKLYVSDFNLGQRGSLLQMLEDVNINDYDYIQFIEQSIIPNEPLSTYCDILMQNKDVFFVTGCMNKEHAELGWRKSNFGKLCEKITLRGSHMFISMKDFKTLLPIHLDSQYGEQYNSSWDVGLDWELSHWNPNSPIKTKEGCFILCLPNGVTNKNFDSNEYYPDELRLLRYS